VGSGVTGFAFRMLAFECYTRTHHGLVRHYPRHSGTAVHPYTPCAARQKTLNPATALREGKNLTLTVPESTAESGPESAANWTGIGAGSREESAKANPPESAAKERTELESKQAVHRDPYSQQSQHEHAEANAAV
jgi:hypothetical protein